jgi:hypothetical protein
MTPLADRAANNVLFVDPAGSSENLSGPLRPELGCFNVLLGFGLVGEHYGVNSAIRSRYNPASSWRR